MILILFMLLIIISFFPPKLGAGDLQCCVHQPEGLCGGWGAPTDEVLEARLREYGERVFGV